MCSNIYKCTIFTCFSNADPADSQKSASVWGPATAVRQAVTTGNAAALPPAPSALACAGISCSPDSVTLPQRPAWVTSLSHHGPGSTVGRAGSAQAVGSEGFLCRTAPKRSGFGFSHGSEDQGSSAAVTRGRSGAVGV